MKWYRLYEWAQHIIEEINIKNESPDNKHIQRILKKRAYEADILNQDRLDLSCLGCIPYFLMNWNIYDLATNKTTIALIDKSLDLLSTDKPKKGKISLKIKR